MSTSITLFTPSPSVHGNPPEVSSPEKSKEIPLIILNILFQSGFYTLTLTQLNRYTWNLLKSYYVNLHSLILSDSYKLETAHRNTYAVDVRISLHDNNVTQIARHTFELSYPRAASRRLDQDEFLNSLEKIFVDHSPSVSLIRYQWRRLVNTFPDLDTGILIGEILYSIENLPEKLVKKNFIDKIREYIHQKTSDSEKQVLGCFFRSFDYHREEMLIFYRAQLFKSPSSSDLPLETRISHALLELKALAGSSIADLSIFHHFLLALKYKKEAADSLINNLHDFFIFTEKILLNGHSHSEYLIILFNAIRFLVEKRTLMIEQTRTFCRKILPAQEFQTLLPTIDSIAFKLTENAPSATDIRIVWKALANSLGINPDEDIFIATNTNLYQSQRHRIDTIDDKFLRYMFNQWLNMDSRKHKITYIEIRDPNLERFPDIGELNNLHGITLECPNLKVLPEKLFSSPQLNVITFRFCSSLERLPESISQLPRLDHLEINSCTSLKHLPKSFPKISKDLQLFVADCPALENFPENQKNAFSKIIYTLYGGRDDPINAESVEKIHKIVQMINNKNFINIQTTHKMYKSLSERSCETTTEGMINLAWLNPKSDYFTEENIALLPPILRNKAVRIFLSWVVRIISFGMSSFFANPLRNKQVKFEFYT